MKMGMMFLVMKRSVVEDNLDQIAKMENYVDYIAKRPRAQRFGAPPLTCGHLKMTRGMVCYSPRWYLTASVKVTAPHQLIGEYAKKDNCTTANEFVERAVEFYVGYISAED